MARECLVEAGELMVVIHTPNWKRIVALGRLGFPRLIIPRPEIYTIVRTRVIIYFFCFFFVFLVCLNFYNLKETGFEGIKKLFLGLPFENRNSVTFVLLYSCSTSDGPRCW